jgi:sugar lactone lactonase YvrE
MKTNTLLASAILFAAAAHGQAHELVKKWETTAALKVPESVIFDGERDVLYVANIGSREAWADDGDGSIGKVALDGTVIEAEWVKGLDGPKGMGIWKGQLYVADNHKVVVIDIETGVIAKTIPIEISQKLNDVTIDRSGVLYVSDSGAHRVYSARNGEISIIVENLKGTNGILAHGDDFYVLDAGGLYRLDDNGSMTLIVDGMEGGTDGVENVAGSDFIVSTWSGVVYYVDAKAGTKQTLLDGREKKINSADIGFDPATKMVYIPTFFGNTVAAYEVR